MTVSSILAKVTATPSFLDTHASHDIFLPKGTLQKWLASDRTDTTAEQLLEPYKVYGTVLISDASGLSKLSSKYDLVDLLGMIHQPKKILYEHALDIGGVAVGKWVADNTMLYFPETVDTKRIHDFLFSVQTLLSQQQVQTSMGVYTGEMYMIDNTVFGPEIEAFDHIAENDVPAGKVWCTEETLHYLNISTATNAEIDGYYVLPTEERVIPTMPENTLPTYPHGFTTEFYTMLDAYSVAPSQQQKEVMWNTYGQEKTVVFIQHKNSVHSSSLAGYLDRILISILWRNSIHALDIHALDLVKVEGTIAIFVMDSSDIQSSVLLLKERLAQVGFSISGGVDRGMVLLFKDHSISDIAGEPVNIASKLAEDIGEESTCYLVSREGNHDTVLYCSGVEIPVLYI